LPNFTEVAALLESAEKALGADVILVNAAMTPGVENMLRAVLDAKEDKREEAFVILVTEGGDADTAYQIGAMLQASYERITVCVAGWCKSAGTLIAICADVLIVGPRGQLGPIDVQIAKRDELGDRDSGLVLSAALASLSDQAFGMFERYMMEIKNRSGGAVTFRTAADIATRLTIGMMSPIFEKIDPVRMGADQRAQNVGRDYAIRLNLRPGNLADDSSLNMLLNGYSSHSFVIDYEEAGRLFTEVKGLDGQAAMIVALLNSMALTPQAKPMTLYVADTFKGAENDDEEDGSEQEGDDDQPDDNESADADGDPKPSNHRLGSSADEGAAADV
jgi:hypothetical protein